ncbi:SigE family RNA polymerase sigma factor [Catellatospora sp. NEAU-YM18]|nr:SigE family RNA polymerase sigma factor [Catellatospora tritici]
MNRYDGFHEFVVARGGALSRTAFLLTGEHHAAEDLVQTALAKAAARWRQIRDGGQPEAYVRRIMINEQISWWRRRPARPVAEVPDRPGGDQEQRAVDRIALGRALDRLTPRQRATVVLRFYEDLSEAATASALGCSVGSVKRNTHDALVRLREALPLYAEQAGQYANPTRAVTAAKRHRTARVAGVAGLVLVPVLVGLVLLGPGRPDSRPLLPPSSPSASPSPSLLPLPGQLPDRRASAQPLPRDRGVGRGVALTRGSDPGPVYLVTADGAWWRQDSPPDGQASLSPDGRWLATMTQQEVVVRDLTGTQEHLLPQATWVGWAPSGGWLFVQTPTGPGRLVSLSAWSVREVDAATTVTATAVLDTGELLRILDSRTTTRVPLQVVDPATGAARLLSVDAAPYLGEGEDLVFMRNPAGPGSGFVVALDAAADGVGSVQFFRHGPDGSPPTKTGVIEFSLADGRLLRRVDLVGAGAKLPQALCYRGGDLIWSDGTSLRLRSAGAASNVVVMPKVFDTLLYRVPGCLRSLQRTDG